MALMKSAHVPGVAIYMSRDGAEDIRVFGMRHVETGAPVDRYTVFEAASLSKPVVALAALQFVDEGKLDLDEPLSQLTGALIPDDPATAMITARHVLSHTTGLPNWRRQDVPLGAYFPPGSRFSYSGEGYLYLQAALERLAGVHLDVALQERVFDPLQMNSSSFIWRDSFDHVAAFGHNTERKVESKFKPDRANAAFSLHTTAADYGKFVVAAMNGALLSEPSARAWMEPQKPTPKGRFEALERIPPETEPGVYWGLGWGIEPDAGTFFHWGWNPGMTAFVLAAPVNRTAFVAFMNSDKGLDIVPGIAAEIIGGEHPSLAWLGLSLDA